MAILFVESPDATQGTQWWFSVTGSVTYDTTAARKKSGLASWKADAGAANDSAYITSTVGPTGPSVGARLSFYVYVADLPDATVNIGNCAGILVAVTATGVLRLYAGPAQIGSDGSTLSTGVLYRLSIALKSNASSQITDAKLFLDGTEDITATGLTAIQSNNLSAGWMAAPGANKTLNFQHVYLDNDTSLTDTGDMRVTAKRPTIVHSNVYNTTGGSGAVNERPIGEANYRAETAKIAILQDYNLQGIGEGDVNLLVGSPTLVGRCAWMWWKTSSTKNPDQQGIMDNGSVTVATETETPSLFAKITTSATYPDNVAGIGQRSTGTADDTYLYECGTLIAYTVAGAGGTFSRTVATVRAALWASIKRTLQSVTAALKWTRSRTVAAITAVLVTQYIKTVLSVVAALSKLSSRTVASVVAALSQSGITRTVQTIRAALLQTYSRTVASVTASLKISPTRTIQSLTTALSQSGVTRTVQTVRAALSLFEITQTVQTVTATLNATVVRTVAAVTATLNISPARTLQSITAAISARR